MCVFVCVSLHTMLAKTAEGLCSILSPSVVQWDAMTVFTECVLGQIFKILGEEVTGILINLNKCVDIDSWQKTILIIDGFFLEIAHRSEHGAPAGRTELWHQRPAHPVLCPHQRLCSLPVCHTQTKRPVSSPLQGQLMRSLLTTHSFYLQAFSERERERNLSIWIDSESKVSPLCSCVLKEQWSIGRAA